MLRSKRKSHAIARRIERSLGDTCTLRERVADGEGGYTWADAHVGVDCYVYRRTTGQRGADASRRARRKDDEPEWRIFFRPEAPVEEGQRVEYVDPERDETHLLSIDAIRPGSGGAFFLVQTTEINPHGGR